MQDFEKIQNYLTTSISAMSGKIDVEKFILTNLQKPQREVSNKLTPAYYEFIII